MFSVRKSLGVNKEDSPLLYTAYFAFFCSGMMSNILGSILPYIREDYNFDYAFLGTLSSISQIGNLSAVWVSGFLPYLIGRKNSTLIMGSGIVTGMIIMAISGNPIFLLLAFLLVGIGRGTMSNITNVVVGQYATNKTAGLNLLHATFAIGAIISPSIIAATRKNMWRVPPLFIAFLMAIALFLLYKSKLSNKREVKEKDESTIPLAFSFWLNTFIMFFYLCTEASLMNWMVSYFKDSNIFSPQLSNMMSALMWVTMLIGRLLCAYLGSRMNKSILILILGSMLTLFYSIMVFSSSPVIILISILGIGLSMSGIYPTTLSTHDKKYNQSTIATGTCIAVATFGAIIMPIIIGNVSSIYGIESGMKTIFIPLLCLLSLMITKVIYTFKRKKESN